MAVDPSPLALDAEKISSAISNYWRVIVTPETTSTQNDLSHRARNGRARSGDICVTEFQSAGRGRLDRTFVAPEKSALLFSIFLEPKRGSNHWGLLSLLASVAVHGAIMKVGEISNVTIKWPNDILIDEKKCAGLLSEVVVTDKGLGVIIGIGINVDMNNDQLPIPTATSLGLDSSLVIDRNLLLSEILNRFEARFLAWESGADQEILREYLPLSSTIGRDIEVTMADGQVIQANAQGLTTSGQLVLASGQIISVGDVRHLR